MEDSTEGLKRINKSSAHSFPEHRRRRNTNSFYEANITVIPKPGSNDTKKENPQTNIPHKYIKILNKVLVNRIQQDQFISR